MLSLVIICLISETEQEAVNRLINLPRYAGAKTEVVMPDDSRCDILTDENAWEVDWADKWAEGVGQALLYGIWTGKKPGLILLIRSRDDKIYILRAKLVCEKVGIELRCEQSIE